MWTKYCARRGDGGIKIILFQLLVHTKGGVRLYKIGQQKRKLLENLYIIYNLGYDLVQREREGGGCSVMYICFICTQHIFVYIDVSWKKEHIEWQSLVSEEK